MRAAAIGLMLFSLARDVSVFNKGLQALLLSCAGPLGMEWLSSLPQSGFKWSVKLRGLQWDCVFYIRVVELNKHEGQQSMAAILL